MKSHLHRRVSSVSCIMTASGLIDDCPGTGDPKPLSSTNPVNPRDDYQISGNRVWYTVKSLYADYHVANRPGVDEVFGSGAARLTAVLAGERSLRRNSQFGVVFISGSSHG